MKTFVAAAGAIFGLLVLVHVWRAMVEPGLLRDPWYWMITIGAGALSAWAWLVLRRSG